MVSRDEWLAARKELLAREKQLTREYDAVCALRRELPWVKVDKEYVFEGPKGKVTLADHFDGRRSASVSSHEGRAQCVDANPRRRTP
jgi:predicted dithiol-disulfide oxidoreductase (DUF899 family)